MTTKITLVTAVGSVDLLDVNDMAIYLDLIFNGNVTKFRIFPDGTILKQTETKDIELKEVTN